MYDRLLDNQIMCVFNSLSDCEHRDRILKQQEVQKLTELDGWQHYFTMFFIADRLPAQACGSPQFDFGMADVFSAPSWHRQGIDVVSCSQRFKPHLKSISGGYPHYLHSLTSMRCSVTKSGIIMMR